MQADPPLTTGPDDAVRERQRALLIAAIDDSARRLTFGTLLCRLLQVVALATLFPLVVVIADHVIPGGLPQPAIFGAGILWGLATVLTLMGVSLRTLLRRLNRLFVARQVERLRGIKHNYLINTVLLQRSEEAAYTRNVAVQQAATALAQAGPEAPDSSVSLRRPGYLLLAVMASWVVYTAITPKPILPSLARLFGADRDAPTATRLKLVRPGPDQPVYAGEPLHIEFAASGRAVAAVDFELLDPQDHSAAPLLGTALQRVEDSGRRGLYGISLAGHEVSDDLHYRCRAGDATAEGIISVRRQPDLVALQINLVPPAYLNQPAHQTTDPELHVWAGTRATFVALANTAITDPVFVLRKETETRTRMAVDPAQPSRASLSLPLSESGEYWLEFSDQWGRPSRDPARHRIVVRSDSAPWVEITTPSREETLSDTVDVTHTAWLRVVAADDVRLDGVFLVRDAGGTLSRRSLLDSQTRQGGRRMELGVATSDLPLEVGESVRVWFEARDGRVLLDGRPSPQIGKSRTLTLVRSPEVIPEEVGGAVAAANLTDATGRATRVVTRQRVRRGEQGEVDDSVDVPGDDESRGGSDSGSGVYRRAPGGGTDDQTTGDQQPGGLLDPENIVEMDDEADDGQESAQGDDASSEQQETERQFEQELRRFARQHGDEAREVNQRVAGESEDAGAEDDRRGEGEAGDRGESELPQGDSESDSQDQPNSKEAGDSEPGAADEVEQQPQAESQPTESEPAERERSDQQRKADDASGEPPSTEKKPEDQRGHDSDETSSQEPERPEGESAPEDRDEKEDKERAGGSEEQDDGAKPEPGDREADDSQTGEGEGRSQQGDESKPEQESAAETGADDQQHGAGRQPAQRPSSPEAEDGATDERVIPMPGDPSPPVEPPAEPERRPGAVLTGSPEGSGPPPELTDSLELLRRGDEISEEELMDLGWPPEKSGAFVRDFERLRGLAQQAGVLSQLRLWRARLELGSGEVTPGRGLAGEVSIGVKGGPSVRDGLEQIAPPAEQRVAPELRALLEAYYRSLAEKREQQDKPEDPSSP